MKKIITYVVAITLISASTGFIVNTKSSTGKAGFTGSPGEGQCNTCHSGGTSIASSATIIATPSFTANKYVPGTTYTIIVGVGAVGFSNFGFGAEILSSTNTNIGTMQNPGAGVQFINASNGRNNATHTAPKNGSNSVNFTFEWVAPTSGAATIYVCGNAVNLNGNNTGDLGTISASLALIDVGSTVGIKENNLASISDISILPNPVNDIISISYLVSKAQNVNLQLVDINGKLVKQLLNEKEESGFHTTTTSIDGVAKGVYFVKVLFDGIKVSQKLVVIN